MRFPKRNLTLSVGRALRKIHNRDRSPGARSARHAHLTRMRQGRTRWAARYADVYDKQGLIVASRYLGHFIVVR